MKILSITFQISLKTLDGLNFNGISENENSYSLDCVSNRKPRLQKPKLMNTKKIGKTEKVNLGTREQKKHKNC